MGKVTKKKLFLLIVILICLAYFALPELIVFYLLQGFLPSKGIKYNIDRFSGCTTVFTNCKYGQRITYLTADPAEKTLASYKKELASASWKKSFEYYHVFRNDSTQSFIHFEKDIFMRKYNIDIIKTEESKFYPKENNQLSVVVLYQ